MTETPGSFDSFGEKENTNTKKSVLLEKRVYTNVYSIQNKEKNSNTEKESNTGKEKESNNLYNIDNIDLSLLMHSKQKAVMCFRVPYFVYVLYSTSGDEQKRLMRDLVNEVLTKIVTNKQFMEGSRSINVNMNININNNVNQAVSDSQSDVRILEERLRLAEKRNKELTEILEWYKDKAEKWDAVQQLIKRYREGVIDLKTLMEQLGKLSGLTNQTKR